MKTVKCPKCATLLKFEQQAIAVRITCPKCATVMQIGGQPKSALPPKPTQARMGAKPKKAPPPKPAAQPQAAANPQATAPQAKKRAAAVTQAATPQQATPAAAVADPFAAAPAADPLAAPAGGGFDLGSLDVPGAGGFGNAAPAAAGFDDPLGVPVPAALPPGHPAPQPKPAAKPGKPAATKSPKSGNKKLLWIGLSAGGLVLLLIIGGLVMFLMSGPSATTAQQSSPSDTDVSAAPSTPDVSPEPVDTGPTPTQSAAPSDTTPEAAAEPEPEPDPTPPPADSSEDASSDEGPAAPAVPPGEFQPYSVGGVSASLPAGKVLDSFPTGIEGQAVRSEATQSTMYVAVGPIDAAITDQEKIAQAVARLVMADIYPGDPCQRSGANGFKGRLSSGIVLPSMEVEIYKLGGKVVVIGWGQPQYEVDLWTPLILQHKKPRLKFDKQAVEAEKAAFLDSIQISVTP